jgi:hypothetical protein
MATEGTPDQLSDPPAAEPVEPAATTSPIAPSPPAASNFVYALGQIEPVFPSLAIEKEFAQATGLSGQAGMTDRQAMKQALTERENRYLARNLCWTFLIEKLETYIVVPRDPMDLELLIDAYRAEPRADDLDLVIGTRTHIASPETCNGLALPVVVVDQLYSFDRETLVNEIPRPDNVAEADDASFRSAAGTLFDDVLQIADNAGATDEHRALNYLAVRYPRIYEKTSEQFQRNFAFTGVEVRSSRLSGVREIMDVVFSYQHRETDMSERWFVRVDVTEAYPFLTTAMNPFYDRP